MKQPVKVNTIAATNRRDAANERFTKTALLNMSRQVNESVEPIPVKDRTGEDIGEAIKAKVTNKGLKINVQIDPEKLENGIEYFIVPQGQKQKIERLKDGSVLNRKVTVDSFALTCLPADQSLKPIIRLD